MINMQQRAAVILDRDVATTLEVAQALKAMSRADMMRLEMIAKARARFAPGLDWRDLLHEALAKALDGTRRWPRRLSFLLFLRQTMRSEASEYARRRFGGPVVTEAEAPGVAEGLSPLDVAAADEPDPERSAMARDELNRIVQLFSDDKAALAVIAGLAVGLSPDEVQKSASLTPTDYAAAQKRIRRRLAPGKFKGSGQ